MSGLYIHIPFCKKACHYCDFHFSTNLKQKEKVIDSLLMEISLREKLLRDLRPTTLYFGGGTPSILESKYLAKIMQKIIQITGDHFEEITIESNPDDLSLNKLKEIRSMGFNRLSIGIQTFNENLLQYINRAHTREDALRSFEDARHAGFENINLDLIYGIPGSTQNDLVNDLVKINELHPEHISIYGMTIEENTVFGRWLKKGELIKQSEDNEAVLYERILSFMVEAGYSHYEISNFSLPGYKSRHNSGYWDLSPYIGIGPGAHSFDGENRWWNISNNARYNKLLEEGKAFFEVEEYNPKDRINEYILTSLRTMEGINTDFLNKKFNHDINSQSKKVIETYVEGGFLSFNTGRLSLTRKGKLISDQISSELFID
ncbi:MAG: radical SAM family heme chaperone HemW [Cyclobacteriaceae bacterium]|nr:radical SAM family heme chaperone HemW [Cyclobacteriaceae bacterium]